LRQQPPNRIVGAVLCRESDSFADVRLFQCELLRWLIFADAETAIGKETAFNPIFGPFRVS
jgi:hypothetical protein